MIVLVDPGAATTNLGDRIISQAVQEHFVDDLLAGGTEIVSVPLHGPIDDRHRGALRAATDVVVCGTNLLSDHMRFRRAWTWPHSDINLAAGKVTVFGAGWWQYQTGGVDWPTRRWLRALSGPKPWAVRDIYSADRLKAGGIAALHTSCPTLWNVREQRMPGGSTTVVATFTDYSQHRTSDATLLALLRTRFDQVWLWPQGPGDASYFESLGVDRAATLAPTVAAFDAAVREPGSCYVGLRLHGGIRAAQWGVPSLVLSVDNRAREIGRSVGLICPSRHALSEIRRLLDSTETALLDLPDDNIREWRARWAA